MLIDYRPAPKKLTLDNITPFLQKMTTSVLDDIAKHREPKHDCKCLDNCPLVGKDILNVIDFDSIGKWTENLFHPNWHYFSYCSVITFR